ncbi:unnamed protein product, partial [Dibothriocephalus latus]
MSIVLMMIRKIAPLLHRSGQLVRTPSGRSGKQLGQEIPDMSFPENVKHQVHITVDPTTGEFTGMPEEWAALLSRAGISKLEQQQNLGSVLRVLDFYASTGQPRQKYMTDMSDHTSPAVTPTAMDLDDAQCPLPFSRPDEKHNGSLSFRRHSASSGRGSSEDSATGSGSFTGISCSYDPQNQLPSGLSNLRIDGEGPPTNITQIAYAPPPQQQYGHHRFPQVSAKGVIPGMMTPQVPSSKPHNTFTKIGPSDRRFDEQHMRPSLSTIKRGGRDPYNTTRYDLQLLSAALMHRLIFSLSLLLPTLKTFFRILAVTGMMPKNVAATRAGRTRVYFTATKYRQQDTTSGSIFWTYPLFLLLFFL